MTDPQSPTGRTERKPATGTEATGTEAKDGSESLGELVDGLTSDVGTLIRREVELALTEMKQELVQAAKAGGMLGGGGLAGYFSLLFASLALAWLLDKRLPRWLAFALVAAIHGAVAAALLRRGREEILEVDPVQADGRNPEGRRGRTPHGRKLTRSSRQTRSALQAAVGMKPNQHLGDGLGPRAVRVGSRRIRFVGASRRRAHRASGGRQ